MFTLLASLGGPIAGLFVSNVSFKTAKIVGGVVAVVLLIVVLGVGKCSYDRALIRDHDAGRSAAISNDTVSADRSADEAAANRAVEFDASQSNLTNAAAVARAADPAGAAKPVGPVSRSYYDTLPEKKK